VTENNSFLFLHAVYILIGFVGFGRVKLSWVRSGSYLTELKVKGQAIQSCSKVWGYGPWPICISPMLFAYSMYPTDFLAISCVWGLKISQLYKSKFLFLNCQYGNLPALNNSLLFFDHFTFGTVFGLQCFQRYIFVRLLRILNRICFRFLKKQ
jgi:hypothetical protein